MKIGEETLQDITIIISQSAKVRIVVRAPYLYRYRLVKNQDLGYTHIDENTPTISEFTRGITIDFLDSLNKIENSIYAQYAQYEDNVRNFLFKGNVIIGNKKGDTLRTEELYYNSKAKKLYTDSAIVIKGKDQIIHGIGFESSSDFNEYEIKNVHESLFLNSPINED